MLIRLFVSVPETSVQRNTENSGTGKKAGINFPIHPHMLRHACGFKLANDGQDTRAAQHCLGPKNIQHTVRHTELNSERIRNFRKD
jgi:type 1 fimbriae regulatory protein FimE